MRCRTVVLSSLTFPTRIPADFPLLFSGVFILLLLSSHALSQPARGANKFLGNITQRGQVPKNFSTYWNHIMGENECKWGSVEMTRDRMNWRGADSIAAFARRNNISWTFYALFMTGAYPGWQNSITAPELLEEIEEWMDSAAARYPDAAIINVINENYNNSIPGCYRQALGGEGTTGFDWAVKAFRMARERWPEALLMYNDYNNLEWESYNRWTIDFVTALLDADAPIDVVGCEAHDTYTMPTDSVKMYIDRIAALGLPVIISEYDISEGNDAVQDSIMREQFTMFWNHPKIVGINYWGYIVGSTWRDNTGLITPEGAERPALTWLVDYVKNNPDPPNDFPELFNLGSTISVLHDNPSGKVYGVTAVGSDRIPVRLFDLCGRQVGSYRITSGTDGFSAAVRASGTYVLQWDNFCKSLVKSR